MRFDRSLRNCGTILFVAALALAVPHARAQDVQPKAAPEAQPANTKQGSQGRQGGQTAALAPAVRQLPAETPSSAPSTIAESETVDRLAVSAPAAHGVPQRGAWWAFWRRVWA